MCSDSINFHVVSTVHDFVEAVDSSSLQVFIVALLNFSHIEDNVSSVPLTRLLLLGTGQVDTTGNLLHTATSVLYSPLLDEVSESLVPVGIHNSLVDGGPLIAMHLVLVQEVIEAKVRESILVLGLLAKEGEASP